MLAGAPLTAFRRLDGRVLIALDGTEHFCSCKIECPRCLHRRRADGGEEHFRRFLGARLVAPGDVQVLPLAPEFITPRTGPRSSSASAMPPSAGSPGPGLAPLRPVDLGDNLFARQSIVAAGGSFILICKPSSHQIVNEYQQGAKPEEHRETVLRRGKRIVILYRWMTAVPLRAGADAIAVNWFSIPWEMLPREMGCGSGVTCWRRLRDWQAPGVWERLHRELLRRLQDANRIDRGRAALDRSSIAAKKGVPRPGRTRPIGAVPAPNATSSRTVTVSRSRSP
jgi:hypothetical protein